MSRNTWMGWPVQTRMRYLAAIMQFDPHSIITSTRNEMSEVDKVGLNLIYKPCKGPHYNPHLSAATGMWYCGRKVMGRYISCCGPNSSANCHACRVLRNDIVQKQKDKGKWQGSDWLVLLQELFWTNRLVSWRILWPKQWTPMPWMKKHTDTLNLIACDWFV